jgi:hypothetical protein
MTEPRRLVEGEGIEGLWDEGCYTEARLLFDDEAREFVEPITAFVNAAEALRLSQLSAWRFEIIAQANIDYQNYKLDQLTTKLDQVLIRALEDQNIPEPTTSARYKTYFTDPPSKVREMGLERQVAYSTQWPTLLAQEPEAALQEMAKLFTQALTEARAAIAHRDKATAETRVHRVQKIQRLFEDANNTRLAVYNKMSLKMLDRRLGRDWPESFFRKTRRAAATTPEEQKRSAILQMFIARELVLSEENRKKISTTKDLATLNQWLSRISTITQQDELFGA